MEESIIKIENLTKTYQIYANPIDRLKETMSISHKKYSKEFNALRDVSFEVKRGENIGLIGTNGAGKSTLLKIITGVLSPTSGNVDVHGKVSALLELGAGFNMEYSGRENIYLNGTMMGFDRHEMDQKIEGIIDFADIGDFIDQPVKNYSSGMFARLAFAVAINVDPEILIVDEALSVGDVRFQLKCMNKMKEMMQGGTTVLFVSHDINAIRRFCTHAIWLNKGCIKENGDVNKVADDYLDFLKFGDDYEEHRKILEEMEKSNSAADKKDEPRLIKIVPNAGIAEIVSFKMLNKMGEECSEIELDEFIEIEVMYDVFDENIHNPVLGIAIFGIDDDYVCGLNTMLDHISIPWNNGRNIMKLVYPEGIRALGGRYYFLVSIMDETATVNIHSINMVKEFSIVTDYVGEGRYIIPHEWSK